MSEPWKAISIGHCLADSFSGEWGTNPNPGNAVVFRATDIDDEGRIVGNGAFRRLPVGKLRQKALRDGDILLEGSGGGPDKPVGRVAYFDGAAHDRPAVCSNFFRTLRPARDTVDPRFLLRKLGWFYKQAPMLALQQQTTGIINLKFAEYLASKIGVPQSVPEQREIARVLDTLDTALQETEAVIAKLQAVKQGLLHDLLTRGIDANGERRPPQAEAPNLYRHSSLGWIPNEWEEISLGAIAQRAGGLLQTGPFGSQLHAHEYTLEGVPVVMPQDMVDGELSVENIARIAEQRANALGRHRVRPNDLVFSRRGDLSRCVSIDDAQTGWLCGTGCLLARLPRTEVVGAWLALVYPQPRTQADVMGRAVGSTMANLNTSILGAIVVARPAVAEQDEIVQRVGAASLRVKEEVSTLLKLRLEKAGLMDDLLSGRVRVTPLINSGSRQDG